MSPWGAGSGDWEGARVRDEQMKSAGGDEVSLSECQSKFAVYSVDSGVPFRLLL